ncbi:MAG: hypothetical protein UHM08_02335 [Bacteroidales bacterium]|nr:hypothetical protein [Bacteroidales bacterium]
MDKLLKKYGHIIKDWDSDTGIGENPNEVFYSVWLKKPYVIEYENRLTDGTAFESVKTLRAILKTAYKNEQVWDNL